jgi:hypothetical protein
LKDTFYVPVVPNNDSKKTKFDKIAVSADYMKNRGGFYMGLYRAESWSGGTSMEITGGRYIDLEKSPRNSKVKLDAILRRIYESIEAREGICWDHVVKFAQDNGLTIADKAKDNAGSIEPALA